MTTIGNKQFMVLDSWESACDDVELNINSNVEVKIVKSSPIGEMKDHHKNKETDQKDLEVASFTVFPSLATSKEVKNKKEYTIVNNPQKSYNEVKYDEIKSNRTEAFEKLAHKESLSDRLYKTSICRSSINKEECVHGLKCRFAHSVNELRTSCCLFGNDCRFVKCVKESWINIGNKMCTHMHPNESRGDFLTRIGVDISNIPIDEAKVQPTVKHKVQPTVQHKVQPKELDVVKMPPPITLTKKFHHPIEKVANAIKNKTCDQGDEELKELVIRVPAALSQQAIELALKSGNQHFRVEVI